MKTYKVEVDTTNTSKTTTYGPGKGEIGKDPYRDCDNGTVYVTTDDPRKIYEEFPQTISITAIGVGYSI